MTQTRGRSATSPSYGIGSRLLSCWPSHCAPASDHSARVVYPPAATKRAKAALVTSYLSIQKPSVRRTSCCGTSLVNSPTSQSGGLRFFSASTADASVPMRNEPAGTQTCSTPAPSVRDSPCASEARKRDLRGTAGAIAAGAAGVSACAAGAAAGADTIAFAARGADGGAVGSALPGALPGVLAGALLQPEISATSRSIGPRRRAARQRARDENGGARIRTSRRLHEIMPATATPSVTTTQRSVAAWIRPASLPPVAPPISAPDAITNTVGQSTGPEKARKIAAATLMPSASTCLSALSRVSVSSISRPSTASVITLMPAPKVAAVDCREASGSAGPALGGRARSGPLAATQEPRPQRLLHREQRAGEQDQRRHQRAERRLARVQQQDAADHSARRARRHQQRDPPALPAQIARLRERGAEVARAQRDRVGDVGHDGRQPHRDQHRKRDQRAAAGQRIDGARRDGGRSHGHELGSTEHECRPHSRRHGVGASWHRRRVISTAAPRRQSMPVSARCGHSTPPPLTHPRGSRTSR